LRGGVFCRRRGVLFSHEKKSASDKRRLRTTKREGLLQCLRQPEPEILSFLPNQRRTTGQSADGCCGLCCWRGILQARRFCRWRLVLLLKKELFA
ncbi:MAG: hypothetical protein RR100_25780, partial [Comamonas sp.]